MNVTLTLSWPALPDLKLGAFKQVLESGPRHQEIKVYKVPTATAKTGYFVAVKDGTGPEEVPPSAVKDTTLLAHYTLSPWGGLQKMFVHEAIRQATAPKYEGDDIETPTGPTSPTDEATAPAA